MKLIATVAFAALLACSRQAAAPSMDASFVLANANGLLALDARGQVIGRLAELPKDSAPSSPWLFPDGRAIAFSITLPPKPGSGFGSDIWKLDLDGSAPRPVVEHEGDNVFYGFPLVDPSGKAVYVQRRAAVIRGGSYVGNDDTIERIDLATKQRTRIVDQATDPTLSPDGKTIVYVKLTDGQPQGLWRVGTDGRDNRPFFTVGDTWWFLQAPRFSPDGKTIVFSAAGHNAKSQATVRGTAHLNIPSEIFVAPANGSNVRSVGQTGDDIVPAWSPDGTEVAFVGAGTFNVLTLADGNVRQLSRGNDFFFGDLVWVRR